MATQQYLFRVYHDLLQQQEGVEQQPYQPGVERFSQQQISYNDHIMTFPENVVDLSRVATQLAHAEACLLIGVRVVCVVAFLLDDEKPADETTHVVVFHPFLSPGCEPLVRNSVGVLPRELVGAERLTGVRASRYSNQLNFGAALDRPRGFASYDLTDTGTGRPTPDDKFLAAVISREAQTGRYQNYMITRAVAREDSHISEHGTRSLNPGGTLYNTRGPLYIAALAAIPYQHTGWSLGIDGKLKRRSILLSRRAVNLVSDLAQQRRMFWRQNVAISRVSSVWMEAVEDSMAWFWANETRGHLTSAHYPEPRPSYVRKGATRVAWRFLLNNLDTVIRFINLAGVASGSDSLLIYRRGITPSERQGEWGSLREFLQDSEGRTCQYYVHGRTQQQRVLWAMTDLVGGILKRLYDYEDAVARVHASLSARTITELQYQRSLASLENELGRTWPDLQADWLAVLSLLFTWQLTWDVNEPSRAATADAAIKYNTYTPARKVLGKLRRRAPPVVRRAPDVFGRHYTERPHLMPFRLWEWFETPDDRDPQELEDERLEQERRSKRFFEEYEQAERDRQDARRTKLQAHIDRLRADWMREHVPNPNDPWDYRNFTSRDWWDRAARTEVNAEFVLRALDVPAELGGIGGARAGRKKAAAAARKGVGGGAEFLQPHVERHGVGRVVTRRIRRAVREVREPAPAAAGPQRFAASAAVGTVVRKIVVEIIEEYLEDQLINIIERELGIEPDTQYSDRQFWPWG